MKIFNCLTLSLLPVKSVQFREKRCRSLDSMTRHMSTSKEQSSTFRTELTIPKSQNLIGHRSELFFMGSCFSEMISREMSRRKFMVSTNPQGIMFNPISIAKCIKNTVANCEFEFEDLCIDTLDSNVYHSWEHHSSFSGDDFKQLLHIMNENMKSSSEKLKKSNFLFLTFGSAFAHFLKSDGRIVSNCHKQPAGLFTKRMLTVAEIVEETSSAIKFCRLFNPDINVVITVSPIRHTREGLVQNHLSKSTLLCSAHSLAQSLPSVTYFPSYEIMMDDLRDYRFYAEDMIHPSKAAENYIFEKFCDSFLTEESFTLSRKVIALKQSIEHRPIVKASQAHWNHLKKTLESIEELESRNVDTFHPHIDFTLEKNNIKGEFENPKMLN